MGIILWEMLTGRRLFRGETDHETLARVMSGTIPAPSSLVPGMHPAFDSVVLKALARDISQRFSTCAEMGDALERAAMDAAAAGADGGVAAPRDVAAFMNTVLGQEIAAQRESVRVWLSQRNDPSLAASRPAAPKAILATGVQSIVAPMTAPPRPPGMTSSPPPAADAFAPVVNAPHPEDGDPTTLRLVSSLTNASISVRNKPHSEPPLAGRSKTARIAAIVGVAALLAVGVVVLAKSGGDSHGAAGSGVPEGSTTAASAVTTAPATTAPATSAAATTTGAAPSTATTAEPELPPAATATETPAEPAEGGPKGKGKWKPSTKATSTPAATAAATAPPPATTKPPGDDLSNPYK